MSNFLILYAPRKAETEWRTFSHPLYINLDTVVFIEESQGSNPAYSKFTFIFAGSEPLTVEVDGDGAAEIVNKLEALGRNR